MTRTMTIGDLNALTADLVASGHARLPVLIPATNTNTMKEACASALSAGRRIPGTANGSPLYARDPFISKDRPLTGLQLY